MGHVDEDTIGIDVVTDFAANAASGRPAAKMSDTWRRAKSAGGRSISNVGKLAQKIDCGHRVMCRQPD
jgi:hypothetical protein